MLVVNKYQGIKTGVEGWRGGYVGWRDGYEGWRGGYVDSFTIGLFYLKNFPFTNFQGGPYGKFIPSPYFHLVNKVLKASK